MSSMKLGNVAVRLYLDVVLETRSIRFLVLVTFLNLCCIVH